MTPQPRYAFRRVFAGGLTIGLTVLAVSAEGRDAPAPPAPEETTPVATLPPAPALNGESGAPAGMPDYRIQAGDVIEIKSYFQPMINEKVQVRPDGWISLILVGETQVQGLTPPELGALLTDRYGRFLKNVDIAVMMREFSGQRVYVGGEVRSPTLVPLRGSLTVLQAIMSAGGLLPTAREKSVLLLRATGLERPVARQVDIRAILAAEQPDLPLMPYDVIHVPKNRIARVDQFIDRYFDVIVPDAINFTVFYSLNPQVNVD